MTRAPLLQAALQMDTGDPQSCNPLLKTVYSWDGPPRMKPVPKDAPNFIGHRLGSLVVKGLLDKSEVGGGKRAAWVVRCDCGMWETRSSKALREANEPNDCCVHCRTVLERKRHAEHLSFFNRHGRWPSDDSALGRKRYRLS
jgi:hypothetical protein